MSSKFAVAVSKVVPMAFTGNVEEVIYSDLVSVASTY